MSQQNHPGGEPKGLPTWLSITVVLTLLGLFVYQVVVVGPKGYPTNVIIGGLLGAYAGVDQFIKRRRDGQEPTEAPPPPPAPSPPPPAGEPPT